MSVATQSRQRSRIPGPVDSYASPLFNVLTTIAGCQLWMDASQLTGLANADALTTFTDLSGAARHATGVTTTRPTYYNSANLINSLPVVRFDATTHKMTTGYTVSGAFTIFLVEKGVTSVTYARTINNGGGSETCINLAARNAGNNCYIGGTNIASYQATPLASVHQGCLVATGSVMTYFVDGFQRGSVSAATSITSLGLGATSPSYGTEGSNSDVCEIIIYNSALGTTDRQLVETYLRSKWATPAQPAS